MIFTVGLLVQLNNSLSNCYVLNATIIKKLLYFMILLIDFIIVVMFFMLLFTLAAYGIKRRGCSPHENSNINPYCLVFSHIS